ncbi:MAG: hypothetical protein PHW69_00980 [Elusimicrobiaceae bacterium]|nr:hypothetical protein [Elusimicrobiaceae bacterium]
MKNQLRTVIAAFIVFSGPAFCSDTVAPAEKIISCSAEMDVVSKYVWRGIPLSAKEAYQPSVNIAAYGFNANIWFNYSVEQPNFNKFSEADLNFFYEREWAGLVITPGYVQYAYPAALPYGEGYIKLSCPLGSVSVFTSQNISVLGTYAPGAYYGDAGLSYGRTTQSLDWKISSSLGWANGKFNAVNYVGGAGGIYGQSAFNMIALDGSATFRPQESLYIRPHLAYYRTLSGGLRDAMSASALQRDNLVIGIAIGALF